MPFKIAEQVIGQENAVNIIKKVAKQRRHLLLIGQPGVGKSLVGQALAELLPKEKLIDILAYPNPSDENVPIIRTTKKGMGNKIVAKAKLQSLSSFKNQNIIFFILVILAMIMPWWIRKEYGDIMAAASLIGSMIFLASFILFLNVGRKMKLTNTLTPKLLVDNSKTKKAPFLDATGSHSGALLGDVLHDPLQSFSSNNKITKSDGKKINISTEVNKLLKKHEKELIKKKGYVAAYLKKEELFILAEKNGKIRPIQVLSVNKYKSNKPHIYKITTESGKEIFVTPEHKLAINNKGEKQYIEASKLKKGKKVFVLKD
ncbi:MAG: ATP-binding protein [Nanoarchaeota archaeon]|nr:ATP-binding protein [Nanoarchaeota archaeon]